MEPTDNAAVESTDAPARDFGVLTEALAVQLSPEIAELAVTHRSYAYENGGLPTNERLEFLGDAVLAIVVTDYLYTTFPDKTEGDLAKLRASVVNMHALADVARLLGPGGLGAHLLVGHGEELTNGRDKPSILADALEAVIGAVYLDKGMDGARELVLRLFVPLIGKSVSLGAGLDWKTSLQELTAERSLGVPSYTITATGPDHDKVFTATAVVAEEDRGSGTGRTKKEAEQKAAAAAWTSLTDGDTAESPAP